MALPLPWVDRIFDKLALVYGRDFVDRWAGISIADVKTDWGHELSGFEHHPEAIRHALQTLPMDRPPTVYQFREAAAKAPKMAALEMPLPPVDPAFVKTLMEKLTKPIEKKHGMKEWAYRLQERHIAGEKLSRYQIHCYQTALGVA